MDKDLKIRQLQNKIDELSLEIEVLKIRLQEKENEQIENLDQEDLEKRILESRSIVRAQHPNHSNGEMWGITSLPFYNLANFKIKLGWKALNGDLLKKDQPLVDIELIPSSGGANKTMSLTSVADGRLFILENSEVEEGQVIAVVSNPADNIEDIKRWLELEAFK